MLMILGQLTWSFCNILVIYAYVMAESDTFQLLKRQISRSHVLYAPYTLLTPHN